MKPEQIETICIQGQGGAGKTTAAQFLASQYGYSNFNTGTLFRASAAAIMLDNTSKAEASAYIEEARYNVDLSDPINPLVSVNGLDVSDLLQLPASTRMASQIGGIPSASKILEKIFDEAPKGMRIVAEGKNLNDRPNFYPTHSFFLLARSETRAFRKWKQAQEKGSTNYTMTDAKRDIVVNDSRDSKLLIAKEGTIPIDTTYLSPFEVVQRIAYYAIK